MAAPQYKTARLMLDAFVVVGVLAVIAGGAFLAWKLLIGGGVALYGVAAVFVLNGLAVIASSQMGFAMLDTAVSTRETSELMREFVRRSGTGQPTATASGNNVRLKAER